MKKILTLLCLCCLCIGSAWGEDSYVELCTSWKKTLAYATEYTQDYTIDDLNGGTTTMTLGVQGVYRQGNDNTYFQMNKKTGYFKNATKLPGKITKIETTWSVAKGATKCYFSTNASASSSDATVTVTAATSVTYTPPTDADYFYFNIDVSTGSGSAQMTSCKVYYEQAAPKDKHKAIFSINGSLSNEIEVEEGASITFPDNPIDVSGKNFVGWVTQPIIGTQNNAPEFVNEATMGTEDVTFYAVFATFTGTAEVWAEIKSVPEAGTYAILSEDYFMKASISSNRFENGLTQPSIENGKLTTSPSSDCIWEITKPDTYYRIKHGDNYAGGTSSKNQGALLTDASVDLAKWTISYSSEGFTFENYGRSKASSDSNNKYLRNNGNSGWATYAKTTGLAPRLFMKIGGGSYSDYCTTVSSDPFVSASNVTLEYNATSGEIAYTITNPVEGQILSASEKEDVDWISEVNVDAANGKVTFTISANTGAERSADITLSYEGATPVDVTVTQGAYVAPQVAAPTFSVKGTELKDGIYANSVTVTLGCTQNGAKIFYSLDETNPAAEYTEPIVLSETTTIKAIAKSDGMTDSEVASKTYTVITPLTTMDEIFTASETAGNYWITFNNWVVSGVKGSNAYLTDNNGSGLIIYKSGHGFVASDVLSGTVECVLTRYNGAAEITNLTSTTTGLTVTKNGTLNTVEKTIAALSGVNTGAYVDLGELTYNGANFIDEEDNAIKPYNTFMTLPTLYKDKTYRIKGIYIQFVETKEIAPLTGTDFELKTTMLASPTDLSATTTPSTATLTWCAVENATNYTLSYKKQNETAWTEITDISTTSQIVNGLATETTYDWKVVAVGNGTDILDSEAAIGTFTTLAASQATQLETPKNVAISELLPNSATLTWDAVDNAVSYTIIVSDNAEYYKAFEGIKVNSCQFAGLKEKTVYTVLVQAIGDGTEFINGEDAEFEFTTPDFIKLATPSNVRVSDLMPTTATLTWDVVDNAISYTIMISDDAEYLDMIEGVESNSYVLADLTEQTTYTVLVQAIGDGVVYSSSEDAEFEFTTRNSSDFINKVFFYESFDTNDGTGGNDDKWSGSIASNKIAYDNEGWTFANEGGANQCAKFGSGSKKGSATTPEISFTGDAVLTFKAAAWNAKDEGTTLNISISAGNENLSQSSVTLTKGAWTEYTLNITNATGDVKIKFEAANASNNRFFLDEVMVTKLAEKQTFDLAISSAGAASLYLNYAVEIPSEITAYTATLDGTRFTLTPIEGGVLPAETPVVILGNEGNYTLNETTNVELNQANNLLGTLTKKNYAELQGDNTDKYVYILQNGSNGIGFYKLKDTGSLSANRAYLYVDKSLFSTGDEVKGLTFSFDDEVDAINSINADKKQNDGAIYNLNGQRLNSLQKGINIVNGKKVYIR